MNICTAPCPVVFDLDGTLIDSAPDIHASVNAVLGKNGRNLLTLQQVRSFIGGGVDVLWDRIIVATETPPEAKPDLLAAFMVLYHDANTLTQFYPGVVKALEVLADRGHPLGICTNKPLGPTLAILRHLGMDGLFGQVIGGDSLPQRKPHPQPLVAALTGLGAHPDQPRAFYVGDSEYDAVCAAAVPVPFLLFTQGYRSTPVQDLPHLASFDDFDELPALIETNAGAIATPA